MNKRPTIREQIDACRPDSDDLHLPEHAADLAELQAGLRDSAEVRGQWDQIQTESRVIRAAMHDVSLPAGLEARLLAAVQGTESVPTLAGVEQAAKENVPIDETTLTPAKVAPAAKTNRRWLLFSGPVAAAAVIMGIVVSLNLWKTDQPISKDDLASQVQSWLPKVDVNTMTKSTKPAALPAGVLGTSNHTSVISSSQGNIKAYSLKRGGSSAILLVLPTRDNYPVPGTPFMKLSGISGGWEIGVWQSKGVLYVIAVPHDSGHLTEFVRPPQFG